MMPRVDAFPGHHVSGHQQDERAALIETRMKVGQTNEDRDWDVVSRVQ